MKQTSLFKQFFLVVLLLVGSATGAWADDTEVTINFGTTTGYWAAHNDASYIDSDSRTWTRVCSVSNMSGQAAYSQFGNTSNTPNVTLTATAGKDMTLTAFSVTMYGASGGTNPTTGTIYLYKKSGDTETQLATASVSGTDNVICSITSNQAFSSTDELEVKIKDLEQSIYNYGIQEMHIENSVADIKCLQEQLPDICPLCGNPMNICKGGKHEKA